MTGMTRAARPTASPSTSVASRRPAGGSSLRAAGVGSLLALLCTGCGEPKATSNETGETASGEKETAGSGEAKRGALEKRVFHGIRYMTPVGTNIASSGVDRPSHYPDPQTGDVVEIPTRIEPAISLTGQGKTGFFMVEIKKPPEKVTLDGMKFSLGQRKEVSGLSGTAESNGWSLTYQWKNDDGTSTTMRHRHYAMPDSDYDCVYDEGNTKDTAMASAICASITAAQPPAVR